jgi:uncharacterized protein (TIGR04255 family)
VTERVHYANAPITEALIDLRITHTQDFSTDDLATIGEAIGDRYPTQEPMYLHSGQISFQQSEDPMRVETTRQHGGFVFTSQNKQEILQARVDGFSFSTLAPYDRWEPFRDEARRLWELYRSAAKVESITRVAVRYINQFDIIGYASDSNTTLQLKDYLNVYPEGPDDWTFNHFFLQAQMWQEDLSCWLIVNEAPVRPPDRQTALLQLDFDLFREQFEAPWRAENDKEVWDFFEQLHTRKNEVFEASITEKTRGFIK